MDLMTKKINETTPKPGFHIFDHGDRETSGKINWLTGKLYSFILDVELKNHAQMKRWCEENCSDTVAYVEDDGWNKSDLIYFYLESDAAAFKLRWL